MVIVPYGTHKIAILPKYSFIFPHYKPIILGEVQPPFLPKKNPSTLGSLEDLFWEPSGHHLKYVAIAAGGRHSVLLRNDGKAGHRVSVIGVDE